MLKRERKCLRKEKEVNNATKRDKEKENIYVKRIDLYRKVREEKVMEEKRKEILMKREKSARDENGSM